MSDIEQYPCAFHGKEEPVEGGTVCFECGHTWKSDQEIIDAHNEVRAEMKLEPFIKVEQCTFCPLCLHDW